MWHNFQKSISIAHDLNHGQWDYLSISLMQDNG